MGQGGFWAVIVTAIVLVACASPPGQRCTPNATQSCLCASGAGGVQACNAAGTGFSVCECNGSCTPGASRMCMCADGRSGAQTCNAAGTAHGTCDCTTGGCMPGESIACTCANGTNGTQTCDATGTRFTACGPCDGCGTCPAGFQCSGSACVLDGASRWVLTVTRGTVHPTDAAGESWDLTGGAPDPLVCMNVDGMLRCTTAAIDTYTPMWTDGRFPAATAASLQAGVAFEYWDEDVGADDPICAGTVAIPLQLFREGGGQVTCTGTNSAVTYTLVPE